MVPGNSTGKILLNLLRRRKGKTLREELVETARKAPGILGNATRLVRQFILQKQHPNGGFRDRKGVPDLYYTVFGLQSALALDLPVDSHLPFIASFSSGEGLDLVHLCCLVRCRALLDSSPPEAGWAEAIRQRLESYRSGDGGYHVRRNASQGTAYAALLVLGAYQDLQASLPFPDRLVESVQSLMTEGPAWANEPRTGIASANATAAALFVLGNLRPRLLRLATGKWLHSLLHPKGGFRATPVTPLPDLLSTATVLHSLSLLGYCLDEVREPCLDFLDSLWSNQGGFHGHWQDDELDMEYTFYGLLALGVLAH